MFYFLSGTCKDLYEEFLKTDEYINYMENMQPTFDELSKEINYTVDADNLDIILDCLNVKRVESYFIIFILLFLLFFYYFYSF